MYTYPDKSNKQLVEAILKLESEKEVESFLRDLLTINEIQEFSERFQIAKLLWTTKLSYIDIAHKIGTSTTTVTRVAQWLLKEKWGGYRTILARLYGEPNR